MRRFAVKKATAGGVLADQQHRRAHTSLLRCLSSSQCCAEIRNLRRTEPGAIGTGLGFAAQLRKSGCAASSGRKRISERGLAPVPPAGSAWWIRTDITRSRYACIARCRMDSRSGSQRHVFAAGGIHSVRNRKRGKMVRISADDRKFE